MSETIDRIELYIDSDMIIQKFRDHLPVIFAPENLWRKTSFMIARTKERCVIVNVVPRRWIGKCNHRHDICINTVLYERLEKPDNIVLEHVDPSRTILVYGTLLSKYWDPHTGILYRGWHNFSGYPMMRGMVKDVVAIWPMGNAFPYAIRAGGGLVLGEMYINLEPEDVLFLDSVESMYDRVNVKVFPAENVVNGAPIYASMYLYRNSVDGYSALTFRYEDSFYLKSEMKLVTYKYSNDLYVKWLKGNIPTIVSAPHGGYIRPENIGLQRQRNGDPGTLELAELIVMKVFEKSDGEKIPNAVISRIHPSRVDLNRPFRPMGRALKIYNFFHGTMCKILRKDLKKFDKALVLDIHGMKDNADDIVLGTNFGTSIRRNSEFFIELKESLESKFSVSIDKEGYSGFYITQKYGAMNRVDAVQIESGRRIRTNRHNAETLANIIADVILNTFSRY